MILLDTDHLVILRYEDHPRYSALKAKIEAAGQPLATTIVSVEEQFRGWLAEINVRTNF